MLLSTNRGAIALMRVGANPLTLVGAIAASRGEPSHFGTDRYFERLVWHDVITPWFDKPVLRRYRPLENFMKPLLTRGFHLSDFREPSATPEHIRKSERLKYLTRVPYFLFMSWQKPSDA